MSFNNYGFSNQILTVLTSQGYVSPTPIQHQTFAPILAGKDVLGLAQTGTGKTAAFSLPLLERLSSNNPDSIKQALILSPTRELADQTSAFIANFTEGLGLKCNVVYGGVSRNTQARQLRQGLDIIVACPGRLLDLMNTGEANVSNVDLLVLDEADQMLDKGFLPDIRRILAKLKKKRQNLIFSATMPQEVRKLVEGVLTNPVKVSIRHQKPKGSISHSFYQVENPVKKDLLCSILKEQDTERAIVFTRTKFKAKKLATQLNRKGFKASSLQGNLSQNRRQEALSGFKNGEYTVLVATDIAARGIDVTGVTHVINYDMPDTIEAYTHRTGRTGRADLSGRAVTFATSEDIKITKRLEDYLQTKVTYKTFTSNRSGDKIQKNVTPGDSPKRPVSRGRRRKKSFGLRKTAAV